MSKAQKAIQQHGARAVYQAATSHMAGDKANGLTKVGLDAKTMGEVFSIQTEAYKQMGPADQAIDNAQATAALGSIAKRMGRPELPPNEKTNPHTVYLTDAQWVKVQKRGKDWLRTLIDKAK